jgi:hypothetical protein
MDILSDHRITALLTSERDLALQAERARVALERAEQPARRPVNSTGSISVPSPSH